MTYKDGVRERGKLMLKSAIIGGAVMAGLYAIRPKGCEGLRLEMPHAEGTVIERPESVYSGKVDRNYQKLRLEDKVSK